MVDQPVEFAQGVAPFTIARLPEIRFGAGRFAELPGLLAGLGRRTLLVTGRAFLVSSPHWSSLLEGLQAADLEWRRAVIADEPSPGMIDALVDEYRAWSPQVVVGIGGGSVLDAAKALAGLFGSGTRVLDHLEGVGRGLPYPGPALPLVAVPTTAGTGSEATKNAVLSERGEGGYKKSFRDDQLVPRVALVDPALLETCPLPLMRAQGMDAFTQLLESYVSLRHNPFTDALAWSGMQAFAAGFHRALAGDSQGHACIAYASLLSGVCLAQTGLGSVHGLASPLGALFPIPHGVVCGTLVAEATALNIRVLGERAPHSDALLRYAAVGRLLSGKPLPDPAALECLIQLLREWVAELEMPRLSHYGVTRADFPRILDDSRGSSMQTNPLVLTDAEILELIESRL